MSEGRKREMMIGGDVFVHDLLWEQFPKDAQRSNARLVLFRPY